MSYNTNDPQAGLPPGSVAAQVSQDGRSVRLDLGLGPEDRALVRKNEQDVARAHADKLRGPAGIASLFPHNKVRLVLGRRKP